MKQPLAFAPAHADFAVPSRDYSQVRVDFQIGNNAGSTLVTMIENPPGSGTWVKFP